MCGIAGIAHGDGRQVSSDALGRMADALRHRGPDGSGMHCCDGVGFAHVRLSIVDLEGGAQPMSNEDGLVTIVYNGEVYNHVELRAELAACGHRFAGRSDTEVVVHGYEQWGAGVLDRLNGQFAFAIHDARRHQVFLARDRLGVRPLFFSTIGGSLVFGSEVKALFASGAVDASPDYRGLDQVFTFWAARAPATPFAGVEALPPGCYAVWQDGQLRRHRWYSPEYREASAVPADIVDQLDGLLRSSVEFRMRADVTVGAYLSGGLDSSVTASLAGEMSAIALRTFSVTFQDPSLDEGPFQRQVAATLHSVHREREITNADIASAFPHVVWHAETPLTRTAPAPMFLLAKLAREQGVKVVLTGEGADELFLGYELFKEAAVRRRYLRPGSLPSPRLFDRLYPNMPAQGKGEFWQKWFTSAGDVGDPLFSHLPRFQLTARIKDFYSAEFKAELARFDALEELRDTLPASARVEPHVPFCSIKKLTASSLMLWESARTKSKAMQRTGER